MTIIKIGAVVALTGVVLLASCTEEPPIIAETDDIDAFATSVLNDLQPASITESREYCGYIFVTDEGQLAATQAARGGEDYCDLPFPADNTLASYHTHGGYSDEYDNEVPSVDDLLGDFEAKIDGYVGTPGGRVWLVDFETRSTRQLCGVRCIISDPDDDPEAAGFIRQSYTLEELRERFE